MILEAAKISHTALKTVCHKKIAVSRFAMGARWLDEDVNMFKNIQE